MANRVGTPDEPGSLPRLRARAAAVGGTACALRLVRTTLIVPPILLVAFASGCRHGDAPAGAAERAPTTSKFVELARRCKEEARETIVDNAAEGAVNLSVLDTDGYRLPAGRAQLPALAGDYNPVLLWNALLSGRDRLSEVRVIFRAACPDRNPADALVARLTDAIPGIVPACEDAEPSSPERLARYSIVQAYESADRFDIRPFFFRVVDTTDGRVLAEQRSFQLLLGDMPDRGGGLSCWGACQNAQRCTMTPPDRLVKRVFRP